MDQEKLYWLHKFRTTKYYFHFSLLQLLLTVILLSCVTLEYERVVFELEVVIALLLVIDMYFIYFNIYSSIRYLTDREKFFKKIINIIDVVITFMIVGILVLEVFAKFDVSLFLGEVGSIVIDIRYGLQIYRIYALYKQAKENREVNNYQDVKLDNNNEVDLNDDIMVDFVSQKTLPKAL